MSTKQKILRADPDEVALWEAAAHDARMSFNAWAVAALHEKLVGKTSRSDPGLIRKTHLEVTPEPETTVEVEGGDAVPARQEPTPPPRVQTRQFRPDFKKGAR